MPIYNLPAGMKKPILVVEPGWTYSHLELSWNREIWLTGGAAKAEEMVMVLN